MLRRALLRGALRQRVRRLEPPLPKQPRTLGQALPGAQLELLLGVKPSARQQLPARPRSLGVALARRRGLARRGRPGALSRLCLMRGRA